MTTALPVGDMDRRHYLALVGSGLALSTAGCVGGDDDNGGENGGDDSSNDADNNSNDSDDSSSGSEGGSENGNDTEDEEKGEDDSGTDLEEIAFGQMLALTLESGDGEDPAYNDLAKPVLFEASAGDEVTITHSSNAFDAYLVLEGPNGSVVAENDDGDGISLNSSLNSRISTTLTESGEYTIWAVSYWSNSTGPFTLSLEEGLYSGDGTDDGGADDEEGSGTDEVFELESHELSQESGQINTTITFTYTEVGEEELSRIDVEIFVFDEDGVRLSRRGSTPNVVRPGTTLREELSPMFDVEPDEVGSYIIRLSNGFGSEEREFEFDGGEFRERVTGW